MSRNEQEKKIEPLGDDLSVLSTDNSVDVSETESSSKRGIFTTPTPSVETSVVLQPIDEVRQLLEVHGSSTGGSDCVLRTRLSMFRKSQEQRTFFSPLDYLVVLDFEATCQKDTAAGTYEQEVIEFPAILIDVKRQMIVDEFHSYCRPKKLHLSEFCTSLTGIKQSDVDSCDEFPGVLWSFERWLDSHGLLKNQRWCIVTDGLFVNLPTLFKWIYFSQDKEKRRPNMVAMLENFQMELQGHHHSGIDDARNLARICVQMLIDGIHFRPTDQIKPEKLALNKPYCALVEFVGRKDWFNVLKGITKNLYKLSFEV